jgi:hypothetical protein
MNCVTRLPCIHQFGNILVDGLAGELTGEQREYVSIMLENASRIRSVLDSALDGVPGAAEKSTSKIECVSKTGDLMDKNEDNWSSTTILR